MRDSSGPWEDMDQEPSQGPMAMRRYWEAHQTVVQKHHIRQRWMRMEQDQECWRLVQERFESRGGVRGGVGGGGGGGGGVGGGGGGGGGSVEEDVDRGVMTRTLSTSRTRTRDRSSRRRLHHGLPSVQNLHHRRRRQRAATV